MEEALEQTLGTPPKQNPHQGEVTINAIVYGQMPDGHFHPKAVWHDAFTIRFVSETPEQCIDEIKTMIQKIKEFNKTDA